MNVTLPLEKMSTAEKLALMEVIWKDVAKTPDEIPSPDWHEDLLKERQRQIDDGEITFMTWEDAKVRILERTSSK